MQVSLEAPCATYILFPVFCGFPNEGTISLPTEIKAIEERLFDDEKRYSLETP